VASDWREFCRKRGDLTVDGDSVVVTFENQRHHRLDVRDSNQTYILTGIVARQALFAEVPNAALRAWKRNRSTQLVGFRVDRKGRLVGEAWVPKAGLKRDEFLLYLNRVATECDLFEYHLTGKDRE
jgi:hypothetical protein